MYIRDVDSYHFDQMNMDNRKFKVGDEITNGRDKVTVTGISDGRYIITSDELEAEDSYTDNFWYISFSSEDKWELVK